MMSESQESELIHLCEKMINRRVYLRIAPRVKGTVIKYHFRRGDFHKPIFSILWDHMEELGEHQPSDIFTYKENGIERAVRRVK